MPDTLIDNLELRVRAPRTQMPALDEATAKLRSLSAQLDAINGKLAGISTMSAFKRTKAELADLIKTGIPQSKRIPVKTVAEVLGIPDIKDFQSYMSRWKATHRTAAKTVFSGTGAAEFVSASKAAEMSRKFLVSAMARSKDQVAQLQSLFGKGSTGVPPGISGVSVAGKIPLIIPAAQIIATVGPGMIVGKAPAGAAPATGASASRGKGAPKSFREEIADIRRQMQEAIAHKSKSGIAGSGDPLKIAHIRDFAATDIRKAVQNSGLPPGNVARSNALAEAAKLESSAEDMRQKTMAQSMKRIGQIRADLAAARQRGDREEEKRLLDERRAMERRIASQNRMISAAQKSQDKADSQRQKVSQFNQATADAAIRRKVTTAAAQGALADFLSTGGRITSETTGTRTTPRGPVSERIVQAQRDRGGQRETFTATFDNTGASVKRLTRALSEARAEAGYLAGDFIRNTAKVTLWAASVGTLYKALELARFSFSRLIDIGAQAARLDQVFSKIGGSTRDLTLDVMKLAAANGRATDEAMQSAIQWSRMGLTRVQVNEAVRVSLMAANVAELSAAEATEQLQAIMQNYQLQVSQLGTVLGQLNQISNTYNVTNADMLDGISRTAAVAKQAGLPLAELMGIIGGMVGATAQTGANVGNAIKSVTLALSNPELQKKLRTQFGFETTTGGEEIKNLSAILSDLFVKYQHLNDAQRQSLLFQVAGRTQASRMAAMLDNFVRSQTLAINAQLNLNSAEEENTKIKGALKAQLAGLTAEWERFVVVQGNRGPVQAMTQLTSAMRNLLTLMNTPLGNVATTGILGLLMAGGAKSVLTGMAMQGGGGFVSRTGDRVRGAMSNLNMSMMSAMAATMGGGVASNVRTGQVGIFDAQKTSRIYLYSEALLRVGRSSAVTSAAVRSMATALGATTRALGVGLMALRAWLLPIAVISLAIVGFNKGMEAIGLSSEKAESRLAGFNEEAQKAASAANALAQAADLMRTAQNALGMEKGFAGMRPDDQKKMLSQVSEAMFLNEPDVEKRRKMTQEMRIQLETLRQQGKTQEIQNILDGRRTELLEDRSRKLQDEFEALENQKAATEEEIQSLRVDASGWFGRIGRDTRQNKILELERRREELSGSKMRNILDQSNAREEALQYELGHQSALEKQKLILESIAEIFQSINTNNPLDRSLVRMASLDAQLKSIAVRREELSASDESDLASESERSASQKKVLLQIRTARSELMDLNKLPLTGEVDQRIKQKEQEIKSLEESDRKIRNPLLGGELGFASRQQQRQQLSEQEKALQAQRDAIEQTLPLARRQMLFQFGQEQSRRNLTSVDFGVDDTDRLQRQRRFLEGQSKAFDGRSNLTIGERAQQLEVESQLYQTILSLRERAAGIEREINQIVFDRAREARRSLMEAGPAELLRKLAAFRTAMDDRGLRNMSGGQFMSMSPEFRREVGGAQMTGIAAGFRAPGLVFDQQFNDAQNERGRLGFFSKGMAGEWDRYQTEISEKIGRLAASLKDMLPDTSTFAAAAKVMSEFSGHVTQATAALVAFSQRLVNFVPGTALPEKGQNGGRGGAAGFTG